MPTPRRAQRSFVAAARRRAEVEEWLGQLLREWDVRSASTGRWLAAAHETLQQDYELLVTAEYDPDLLLFALEIERGGRTVYGIDDWLG